jgi:hypothetical protein
MTGNSAHETGAFDAFDAFDALFLGSHLFSALRTVLAGAVEQKKTPKTAKTLKFYRIL